MSYESSWDLPHPPEAEENWQESDCYWFFDAKAGIGGWQRIGYHPNRPQGQSAIFIYKIGGKRFLRRQIDVDGSRCRRTERGQTVGPASTTCVSPKVMRYTYDEPDASLSLEFVESFYEPRDWMTGDGYKRETEKGHLECGGRVRGKIRLGDQTYEVDALAHRDRSWGPRSVHGLDVLWFSVGTLGPDLSWAAMKVRYAETGQYAKVGFVARSGASSDLVDVDVNTTFASDGMTPLQSIWKLQTEEETISLKCTPIQGFVHRLVPGAFMATGHTSIVECEGKQGFCDFAVALNPYHGAHLPTEKETVTTCSQDGLSDFQPHDRAVVHD